MAYTSEIPLALPPILKGTAPRIEGTRQYRKQQRPHPKSQPFDPEDLRRRLYVVIAEREAQNVSRQRQRVDAMPAKWAQVERERDAQNLYIERLATKAATWAAPDMTAPTRPPKFQPKPRSQSSLQNKLRCRTSFSGASEPAEADADTEKSPSSYRHIPEQAAAQFSRTTTSSGMQGSKERTHSLSKAALRFYMEGASATDRQAIESSITPGKQRNLLQRQRTNEERQQRRNQFQGPRVPGSEEAPWRRSSKSGPAGETAIAEEEGISALADLHLHGYRDQGDGDSAGMHTVEDDIVMVDAATVNEHRVDWSQSDELLPHEKKGVRLPPLLRKTSSILTLKGKLGHLRKNSGDKENNNKLRIVTIQENCDEQAEAEADDGSTPMSPNSGNSRSGRPGIWGRLKRN